jgi:hypothetical protein
MSPKNLPPAGSLTATPVEVTIPATVLLDSSSFKDPNQHGVIVSRQYSSTPACEITPAADQQTATAVIKDAGNFVFQVTCKDRAGNAGTAVASITAKAKPFVMESGAKLQGKVADQITCLKAMGARWTRTGVILGEYTGEAINSLDAYFGAGLKVACNLTWSAVKPSPFCTDLKLYEAKLRLIFDRYAPKFKETGSVFLCENEALNPGYYGLAPIADYIALCRLFVSVAAEYGVFTADSCSFIEYITLVKAGTWPNKLQTKVQNQIALLYAFKEIPFTFLCFHYAVKSNTFQVNQIAEAMDFVRDWTGHNDLITNEFHLEDCTSTQNTLNPSGTVAGIMQEWYKGRALICIVWSGDHLEGTPETDGNSPADAFSLDAELTGLGNDLKNAIA